MKKYKYTGKQDHNSTIRVDKKLQDLRLSKDDVVELPSDHPVVCDLINAGLLVEQLSTNSSPIK